MPDLSYIAALGHVACLAAEPGPGRSRRGFNRWLAGVKPAAVEREGDLWALYRRWRDGD